VALNKNSQKSDRIADLYRAAFYLAKGKKNIGLEFLKKSGVKFKGLDLSTKEKRLYWAERILDKYLKLRH